MINKIMTSREAVVILNNFSFMNINFWKDLDEDVVPAYKGVMEDSGPYIPTFAAIAIANELEGYYEQLEAQVATLNQALDEAKNLAESILRIDKEGE